MAGSSVEDQVDVKVADRYHIQGCIILDSSSALAGGEVRHFHRDFQLRVMSSMYGSGQHEGIGQNARCMITPFPVLCLNPCPRQVQQHSCRTLRVNRGVAIGRNPCTMGWRTTKPKGARRPSQGNTPKSRRVALLCDRIPSCQPSYVFAGSALCNKG